MQGLHSRAWDQSFSTNPLVDFSKSQLRTPEGFSELGGSDYCGRALVPRGSSAPTELVLVCSMVHLHGSINRQIHWVLTLPPGPEDARMCQPDFKEPVFLKAAGRSLQLPVKFFSLF